MLTVITLNKNKMCNNFNYLKLMSIIKGKNAAEGLEHCLF